MVSSCKWVRGRAWRSLKADLGDELWAVPCEYGIVAQMVDWRIVWFRRWRMEVRWYAAEPGDDGMRDLMPPGALASACTDTGTDAGTDPNIQALIQAIMQALIQALMQALI